MVQVHHTQQDNLILNSMKKIIGLTVTGTEKEENSNDFDFTVTTPICIGVEGLDAETCMKWFGMGIGTIIKGAVNMKVAKKEDLLQLVLDTVLDQFNDAERYKDVKQFKTKDYGNEKP